MSLIKKIWGTRQRLLVTNQVEIDLLFLDKNTACSVHEHIRKINRFILLSGKVEIRSELGSKILVINEAFDVEAPIVHQFVILEKSVMIELAFVKNGKIDSFDIIRHLQGGKILGGGFITLDELKEKGKLDLQNLKGK